VEARGARLLIAYIPTKLEVTERDWQLTRARYQIDEARFDRGRIARFLRQAGRRIDVSVLDLTDALRHADHGQGEGPYFERGGHWNALGHQVAAHEIAATIRHYGWMPCLQ
jgi:hypothetical protein